MLMERAAMVNARASSFEGLAMMAQIAEGEARILKQNRLLREEMAAKKKDTPNDQKGDKKKGGKGDAAAEAK